MENKCWTVCLNCLGRGTKRRKLSKKSRHEYDVALKLFHQSNSSDEVPLRPKGHLFFCDNCHGSGIVESIKNPIISDNKFPHIAIIGAGISGVALAVACKHRGIPFTLFERDSDFNVRSQGYGLTLQQANRVMKGLGITNLKQGVISTRHVAHKVTGEVIGEWGTRRWNVDNISKVPRRTNIHIARQSLRQELLNQLGPEVSINWGHQLIDFRTNEEGVIQLNFILNGLITKHKADLVVGADGIRSTVRRLLLGDNMKPLRYLNCIVILGICPLADIEKQETSLLDRETIFQTANGNERLYVMPFTADSVMWQLSFPMDEYEAKLLSDIGATALKEEAIRRTDWHNPIPQIIAATDIKSISGYPVYDRELLDDELKRENLPVTLIGDAAHPMSPFKGQGANQAILDALFLARTLFLEYHYSGWNRDTLREDVLSIFETEMLSRSNIKVKDSADAASFLHSESVFEGGDQPRGSCRKKV